MTFPPLVVYDTSSTGPPITVAQRHIVIRGAPGAPRRSVMELVALANDGTVTRHAGEPARPTWIGRLPGNASGFTVGQGDVPWEDVMQVCRDVGGTQWFIVEHERYAAPPLDCVRDCLAYLRELGV